MASRRTNVSPSDSCQSMSMRRSASVESTSRLGQSERWIEMPRPCVTYPTTWSPGTGWQHWAYRTISPSTPWILMPRPSRSRWITRPQAVGLGGLQGGEPVARRLRLRARQDLDGVAVLQGPVQRGDAPVDARALAVLAHLRVHREGEVEGRRALGQPLHVAPGREHEDLVLVQVDLEELEKLLGRVGVLLQLDELAEPREVAIELVGGALAFLEEPVGGDAVLRRVMHVAGADLDLVQLPARPEHRRVQRLVAVRLGTRDVVLSRT